MILYNEDGFTAENILGIGHSYSYEQIAAVMKQRKSRIYIGKQIVIIEELFILILVFFKDEYLQ